MAEDMDAELFIAGENVSTVLQYKELTAEEMENDNVYDYFYVIHGKGSERDRKIKKEELKAWISIAQFDQIKAKSFYAQGTNGGATLDSGALKFSGGNGHKAELSADYGLIAPMITIYDKNAPTQSIVLEVVDGILNIAGAVDVSSLEASGPISTSGKISGSELDVGLTNIKDDTITTPNITVANNVTSSSGIFGSLTVGGTAYLNGDVQMSRNVAIPNGTLSVKGVNFRYFVNATGNEYEPPTTGGSIGDEFIIVNANQNEPGGGNVYLKVKTIVGSGVLKRIPLGGYARVMIVNKSGSENIYAIEGVV